MDEILINRVARGFALGVDSREIHAMLVGEGLDEGNCFLTYNAGKLLYKTRLEAYEKEAAALYDKQADVIDVNTWENEGGC